MKEVSRMTVNELIYNFRINLDNGGVLISDSKGQFCALTKRLLKYIGDDEIIHTDSIGGRVFININRPVAMLQRM